MNQLKKFFREIPMPPLELKKFSFKQSYQKIAIDIALILLIDVMIVIYKANK
jgi:hypothetical protein